MDLYQDALASYLTSVDDDERQFLMDSVHVLLTAEEVRKRFGDDTPNPSIEYTKCQMDAGNASAGRLTGFPLSVAVYPAGPRSSTASYTVPLSSVRPRIRRSAP